jgi:hypothetical protein
MKVPFCAPPGAACASTKVVGKFISPFRKLWPQQEFSPRAQ